jgi:hypothetical protein
LDIPPHPQNKSITFSEGGDDWSVCVFELMRSMSCDLVLELQFAIPCALQHSNNCVLFIASETNGAGSDEEYMTGQNQCIACMSIFLKCNFKSIFNYISAEIRTRPIMIFLNIASRATNASGYIVETTLLSVFIRQFQKFGHDHGTRITTTYRKLHGSKLHGM